MSRNCIAGLGLFAATVFSGCTSGGLLGLPGPQDGKWLFTTTDPSASGATYIVQISTDRITSINISGSEWTVTTSFPASRPGTSIIWKVVAQSPAGSFGFQVTKEFDLDVMPQTDGSLTGNSTEGFSIIAGVSSSQTAMFPITMRKI